MLSVDLQQEALRQKVLAATRLMALSIANYSLSRDWERGSMKEDLAIEYILVRSQIEIALKEEGVWSADERCSLASFNAQLMDVIEMLGLVRHQALVVPLLRERAAS